MRKLVLAGAILFAALQLVRPTIPTKPSTAELQTPAEVKRILEKSCYSCHSDQRRLSWFDEIVPAYWFVRRDILTARQHLNFSTLASKPAAAQTASLYEAVNMIKFGAMPLSNFVALHPEAKVTPEELETLKRYLAPWTAAPNAPAPKNAVTPVDLTSVPPEHNGLHFDPTFENWKLLSTTDRGDNGTFRFILGNDVAVKAAQTGNVSPWPKNARFAKIAWQQQQGSDGLLHPGKFIQVEFMVKNAQLYKEAEGWGWGRWRGMDLKPYGQEAHFVNECTSCHRPLAGNDYVYTLPISGAGARTNEALNQGAATLPPNLPNQPLGWGAITMYVDPKAHTTATLYGNEIAIKAVEASRHSAEPILYPIGAVLSLVTWTQREDPHWFGARIPDSPQSIEFLRVAEVGHPGEYRRFTDPDHPAAVSASDAQRADFIVGLVPAQLP